MNQLEILRTTALVAASFLVHLWTLTASKIFPDAIPFGDLSIYEYWAYLVENGAGIYGFETEWVYPALAFVPIWFAGVANFVSYEISWLVLVFLLNTAAALVLVQRTSITNPFTGTQASWAFLLALVFLGPVSVSRIDSVSAALAIFGLVAIDRKSTGIAAAFFTVAGWIKIWPIALFAALLVAIEKRIQAIKFAAAITAGIVVVGIFSGGDKIFSFVLQQQERGIQIESVMATPWIWLARFDKASIFFDNQVLTNQVAGEFVEEVSSVANFLLFTALGVTLLIALRAIRSGHNRIEVFAIASVAGVLDLIVFNKVGSPQFMIWLAVPLITLVYFGIRLVKPALFTGAIILLLTQLVYPVFYIELLGLELLPLWLISIRNALLVVLLIWASLRLLKNPTEVSNPALR